MATDFNPLREKHYSVIELATTWNVSDDLIRRLFRNEPDVVHITQQARGRRRYEVLPNCPQRISCLTAFLAELARRRERALTSGVDETDERHVRSEAQSQGRYYPPGRTMVLVCEYQNGHLELCYRERRLPWTEITGQAAPRTAPKTAPPPEVPRRRRRCVLRPSIRGAATFVGSPIGSRRLTTHPGASPCCSRAVPTHNPAACAGPTGAWGGLLGGLHVNDEQGTFQTSVDRLARGCFR